MIENKVYESNRVKFFPIMMFSIVMGLSGLTIATQKATELFGLNHAISLIFVWINTIVFGVILLTYAVKMILYFTEVKKEFSHPVRINFFATAAISFLLVSIVYHKINSDVAHTLWYIGTFLQTFFTFYTISFWINNNLELSHSNPAWFIPIVGNVLVPVGGADFIDNNILMYYFSVGMFFWIILTAILINRIIFHHQLADKFVPTMFIFIAPPSISFLAYIKMTGEFDMFASFLYNLALFFTFLLFFMVRNFLNLKFFISWWAFTFPLAAVSIASMVAFSMSKIVLYSFLSYFFIFILLIVIFVVSLNTIRYIRKKEICIQE